jgi:hypothetical protein
LCKPATTPQLVHGPLEDVDAPQDVLPFPAPGTFFTRSSGRRGFQNFQVARPREAREIDTAMDPNPDIVERQITHDEHAPSPLQEIAAGEITLLAIKADSELGPSPGFREFDVHVAAFDGGAKPIQRRLGPEAHYNGLVDG